MINFNGNIGPVEDNILASNRSFLFGDAVFETVKVVNSRILFFEDHYFRLMSAMRVVRMEIPMNFTMEYLEGQILSLVKAQNIENSSRVRITVYRNDGGLYMPITNSISFLINAQFLESEQYEFSSQEYSVDLYTDFYVSKQLLSSIKTTNKIMNTMASIYAAENNLETCLLLNENKNVVEAIHGNLFMLKDGKLLTPPITEGCLNGIMRKQILKIANTFEGIEVIEELISPFDLQKADELFITNVIKGVQPITKYRKKEFQTGFSLKLIQKLNETLNQN